MAEDGPIEKLQLARMAAVEARRALAESLSLGNRSVLSNNHRHQFVELQTAIEAIDRAIADERSTAKRNHQQSDKVVAQNRTTPKNKEG